MGMDADPLAPVDRLTHRTVIGSAQEKFGGVQLGLSTRLVNRTCPDLACTALTAWVLRNVSPAKCVSGNWNDVDASTLFGTTGAAVATAGPTAARAPTVASAAIVMRVSRFELLMILMVGVSSPILLALRDTRRIGKWSRLPVTTRRCCILMRQPRCDTRDHTSGELDRYRHIAAADHGAGWRNGHDLEPYAAR